jgi:hypothetical protein
MVETFQSWLRCALQQPTYPATGKSSLEAFCNTLCFEGVTGDTAAMSRPEFFLDHFYDWLFIIRASEPSNLMGMSQLRQQLEEWQITPFVQSQLISQGILYDIGLQSAQDAALIVLALAISRAKLFHQVAFQNAQGRAFFKTKFGRMGVGPTDVQPGDVIALFSGLKVPMIIRGTGMNRRVVGPAFIYGAMHGELWQASDVDHVEFSFI